MAAVARIDGSRRHACASTCSPTTRTSRRCSAPSRPTSRPFARLVTYNGRAFDVPMLAARLTVHGLFREQATAARRRTTTSCPMPDASSAARSAARAWRTSRPACSACGASSDCPGSEVPARYFGYLRGGSPDILAEVLDHNFQDVVSLVLLEAELCAAAGRRLA